MKEKASTFDHGVFATALADGISYYNSRKEQSRQKLCDKIQNGMSLEEVERLIGSPPRKDFYFNPETNITIRTWDLGDWQLEVVFDSGEKAILRR
jgi:hypothetical protein